MDNELETGDTGLDINAAVDSIGTDLGFGEDTPETPQTPEVPETPETPAEPEVVAPVVRAVPKAWPKEMHEHWGKVDPKVQEYLEIRERQMLDGLEGYKNDAGFGKTLREAIAPFEPMLTASNIDAPKAVQYLLGAHQRLTTGTPESKLAAYQELGRNLGLSQDQPNAELTALRQEVQQLKSGFTQEQQAKLTAAKESIQKEVDAFAADTKAHPYFDECSEDIAKLISAGYALNDAYDKAVWANPVSRAKEVARIEKETEAKLRENARLDALKAKKATGSNVMSRETTRAPTEPLGKMDDTMKDTLAEIRARAH